MSREKRSTFKQRVDWLVGHRSILSEMEYEIIKAMKKAGLFAPTTYWCDIKLGKEIRAAKDRLWKPRPSKPSQL
jgi:hypothetical protein